MADHPLTPEQQQEADRLYEAFSQTFLQEARQLAELLASRGTSQLLGQTEFEIRDRLQHLGATALQTVLHERKKGATKAPV